MPSQTDPSQHRRTLRRTLRHAREEAGLSQRDAAERLEWSLSKFTRAEKGEVSLSVTDLKALLELYGVTDPAVIGPLMDAARGSRGRSWLDAYRHLLSPPFVRYLRNEVAASSLLVYHPYLIPGLLQTEEYASALLAGASGSGADVDGAVRLRAQRQQRVFEREVPANARFLVEEAALHRVLGGTDVMVNQLRRLQELADRPEVSVRVLPFSAGAHPALAGSFIVLGFPDEDELLFLESTGGSQASREDRDLTVAYLETFEAVSNENALSESASHALIDTFVTRLQGPAA